jgi:pimeloyl-ACP methyl ester carboxylesterase
MKTYMLPILGLAIYFASCSTSESTEVSLNNSDTLLQIDTTSLDDYVTTENTPSYKHDNYLVTDSPKGFLLLCHQAGWSRGEYIETAPLFNELGYSCMAIDQRSGNEINGVPNIVASMFDQDSTTYADAIPDIEFAIDKAYEKNGGPIILVGSSYSSALVLFIGNRSDKVKAIISFSPGEYFQGLSITDSLEYLNKPLWITSSVPENAALVDLVSKANPELVTLFKPEGGEGNHGSRALYAAHDTNQEYWESLKKFLTSIEGQ